MAETAAVAPKKKSNTVGCGIVLGLVVAAGIGIKSCVFGGGTSYSATVQDFNAMNPSDLAVTFHVTNTGSSAGTPECTVQAHDPSYSYHGEDIGTLASSVAPGATVTTVMHISISGSGAEYVTDVTVTCS